MYLTVGCCKAARRRAVRVPVLSSAARHAGCRSPVHLASARHAPADPLSCPCGSLPAVACRLARCWPTLPRSRAGARCSGAGSSPPASPLLTSSPSCERWPPGVSFQCTCCWLDTRSHACLWALGGCSGLTRCRGLGVCLEGCHRRRADPRDASDVQPSPLPPQPSKQSLVQRASHRHLNLGGQPVQRHPRPTPDQAGVRHHAGGPRHPAAVLRRLHRLRNLDAPPPPVSSAVPPCAAALQRVFGCVGAAALPLVWVRRRSWRRRSGGSTPCAAARCRCAHAPPLDVSPARACRNGLGGKRETKRLFTGLYIAMAFLYVRNIFRFVEFTQVRVPGGGRAGLSQTARLCSAALWRAAMGGLRVLGGCLRWRARPAPRAREGCIRHVLQAPSRFATSSHHPASPPCHCCPEHRSVLAGAKRDVCACASTGERRACSGLGWVGWVGNHGAL